MSCFVQNRQHGTRSLIRVVLVAIAWTAGLAAATVAKAQVEPCDPYYVTVKREGTPLKCRDGKVYYPVKNLVVGEVLRVDGQSASWLRVEYPAGLTAFLKPEWVQADGDGNPPTPPTLKLVKPSRLMAASVEASQAASWWYLLDSDLPAGTVFTITKALKGPDEKVYGYLVPAPKQARGFLGREFVEKSTAAEIEAYQRGQVGTPVGTPAESAATETRPPTPPVPTPPTTRPTVSTTPAPAQPAPADPTKPATAPAPTDLQPVTTPAAATTTTNRPLAKVEALASLYDEATRKPMEQAELEAAVAEFQRAIDALGSTPEDDRVRKHLTPYMQVLKMRADLQAHSKTASSANEAVKQQSQQVAEQIAKLERMRQYNVAGRLVASTVYDGKRLPLMYRVLSPEATSARTLAYVAPSGGGAGMALADKVGRVVGVVGETKFDESLRVNIIVPSRVDVLTASGTLETVTPPSAADQNTDVNK